MCDQEWSVSYSHSRDKKSVKEGMFLSLCGSFTIKYLYLNNYKIPGKTQHTILIMLYSDMFRLIRVIIRLCLNHT